MLGYLVHEATYLVLINSIAPLLDSFDFLLLVFMDSLEKWILIQYLSPAGFQGAQRFHDTSHFCQRYLNLLHGKRFSQCDQSFINCIVVNSNSEGNPDLVSSCISLSYGKACFVDLGRETCFLQTGFFLNIDYLVETRT